MIDPNLFTQYLELSDQLLQVATRDDLIQCLHALATNLSFYETKFGSLPHEEMVRLLEAQSPDKVQAKLLTNTLKTMTDALSQIIQHGKQSH
jgi:hypothetical protein